MHELCAEKFSGFTFNIHETGGKNQISGNRLWNNFVGFEEINCIKKVPRERYTAHNE